MESRTILFQEYNREDMSDLRRALSHIVDVAMDDGNATPDALLLERIEEAFGDPNLVAKAMQPNPDAVYVHDLVCDMLRVHESIGEFGGISTAALFERGVRDFFMVSSRVGFLFHGKCDDVKAACTGKEGNGLFDVCVGAIDNADAFPSYSIVFANNNEAETIDLGKGYELSVPVLHDMFEGNKLSGIRTITKTQDAVARCGICKLLNGPSMYTVAMYPFVGSLKPSKETKTKDDLYILGTDNRLVFTKAIVEDVPCVMCGENGIEFYKPQWMVPLVAPLLAKHVDMLRSFLSGGANFKATMEQAIHVLRNSHSVAYGLGEELAAKLEFLEKNLDLGVYLDTCLPCIRKSAKEALTDADLSSLHQPNIMFVCNLVTMSTNLMSGQPERVGIVLDAFGIHPSDTFPILIEKLDNADSCINTLGLMDGRYTTNHDAYFRGYVDMRWEEKAPTVYLDGEELLAAAGDVCGRFALVRDSNYVLHCCSLLHCIKNAPQKHRTVVKVLRRFNKVYDNEDLPRDITRVFRANALFEKALDEIAGNLKPDMPIKVRPQGVACITQQLCRDLTNDKPQSGGGSKRMEELLISVANEHVNVVWQSAVVALVFVSLNGVLVKTSNKNRVVLKSAVLNTALVAVALTCNSSVPMSFVVLCGTFMVLLQFVNSLPAA